MCGRWSYYLPCVTKEEIEACYDEFYLASSNLVKVTDERVFDTMIKLNGGKEMLDRLEQGVPYIIGAMTNYRLIEMLNFGDYMHSVDPDIVPSKDKPKSFDSHNTYCVSWQKMLRKSSLRNSTRSKNQIM